MEGAPVERRAGLRRPVTMPCVFKSAETDGRGIITNLSKAGAFVESAECPSPGTLTNLVVRWSPEVETQVAAKVVHRIDPPRRSGESPGFGLRFLSVDPGPRSRDGESGKMAAGGFVLWSAPVQARENVVFTTETQRTQSEGLSG